MLLLVKTDTDTLFQQRKIKRQETLEPKLNNQLDTFSFFPPKNRGEGKEERNELMAITSLEVYSFVFKATDEIDIFSISTPGQCDEGGKETIVSLKDFSDLRSQKDTQLQTQEVQQRRYSVYLGFIIQ